MINDEKISSKKDNQNKSFISKVKPMGSVENGWRQTLRTKHSVYPRFHSVRNWVMGRSIW